MSASQAQAERALQDLIAAQARYQHDWLRQASQATPPAFVQFYQALIAALAADPASLQHLQARYYREHLALWEKLLGAQAPEAASTEPPERDPRFRAAEWRELPWFDYLRQSYAVTARWLQELVAVAHTDAATQRKLRFYMQQFIDAMAPSNSPVTNPEAIKLALQTQGASLARGLHNLLDDAGKGRISMTDATAFEVGRNLALTPGTVVYRNELIELLHYRPVTAAIRSRPLLIVPPCINKYYILDLQPENSFVRYAVDNGLNVFIISWRNISEPLGHLGWDDYLEQGVLQALDAVRRITRTARINALGFCVGGTLLAAALAVLRRKRRRPVASVTLLASMLDFADPGAIGVYVDEAYVEGCERAYAAGGIVPGSRLAGAFASLRANELVWRYVVDNYLKGATPPAFDLLYWNCDSANLPGRMYAYYLRHMYLENALREPDRLSMCGVAVDLGRIDLPAYVLATADDHIVPWRSAYASAQLLGRDVTFVLGGSGHIAGIVNPANSGRRGYRTGARLPAADAWHAASVQHAGSWWPHWLEWIGAQSADWVSATDHARAPAGGQGESAPGTYVREQPLASIGSPAPDGPAPPLHFTP